MVQVLGLVQASAALSLKYMEKNLGPSSTAFPAGSEVKQLELELVSCVIPAPQMEDYPTVKHCQAP